jgi:acyl dehydratase
MNFENITTGDTVAETSFDDVPAKNMKIVTALMEDPNPIHFDRRATEQMGRPGLVNQGPINMSYLTQAALAVAESPTDLTSLEARFEENVFEGDDVTAVATVDEKYEEDGDEYVDLDLVLEKADGTTAVTGAATIRLPTGEPT